MITATATKTFTIDKVQGEFTAEQRDPRPGAASSLIIGYVTHGEIKVNNVTYEPGAFTVLYDRVWYEKESRFRLDTERYAKRDFTDAARERIEAGVLSEVHDFFEVPTVEQVNGEALEAAYRDGTRYGKTYSSMSNSDGFNQTVRNWNRAYDAIFGKRWNYSNTMPEWPGVVSELELKAEFLAAAKAEIEFQLADIEKQLG